MKKAYAFGVAMLFMVTPAWALPSKDSLVSMATSLLADLGGTDGPFLSFFLLFCQLIGIVLIATGIVGLTRKDTPKSGCITTIVIGSLLSGLPQMISVLNMTLFDDAAKVSILSSDTGQASAGLSAATKTFINLSIFIIQVVGFLAVYRGLKTIADASLNFQRQPEQTRAALIFVVAGVCCINILKALRIVCGTLGPEAIEYYEHVFSHLL